MFRNMAIFFTVMSCQQLAELPAGVPPLVGCLRLLIQYIRSYPPYRRLFLHPQPNDVPSRGDRDPVLKNIVRN